MMLSRLGLIRPIVAVVVLVGAVLGFPAMASAAPTISRFNASPGDSAGWVKGVDAPGDTDGQAIRLSIPTPGPCVARFLGACWAVAPSAEVDLGNLGSTPPKSPPAFMIRPSPGFSNQPGPCVQMDIYFGDYVDLRTASCSNSWTADAWTLVGGPGSTWIANPSPPGDVGSHIGGCPYNARGTYQLLATVCPSDGGTVVGARVELFGSDPDPVYVDDLSYDSTTFTTGGSATTVTVTNPWDPPGNPSITQTTINKKEHTATFRFTASGTVTGFQCALVRPTKNGKLPKKSKPVFRSCKSPTVYTHLKHGHYKFEIRAVNAAGHSNTAIRKFTI